jgi:hypothetical protein
MYETNHDMKITVRIAGDCRKSLETWAEQNISTMQAELSRAIRERAQRERAQGAAQSR